MYVNRRLSLKFEKQAAREQLRQRALAGEGKYLFQNKPGAELFLPKPANDGRTRIPANGTFEGDSYFFGLVRTNQIKLIKELEITPPPVEETPMLEQKLILDQPDRVTQEGTVESVVPQPKQKKTKNESRTSKTPEPEVLLTEDPMSGVEILND